MIGVYSFASVFSEVIAVNQDALGMQGRFQKSINDIEIWTRPLKSGNSGTHEHDFAVAFVSQRTDGQPYKIRVDLSTIGLTNAAGYKAQVNNCENLIMID